MANYENIKFIDNTPHTTKSLRQAQDKRILEAVIEWHSGVVQDMLVGSRSGRMYRIPGGKRTYQASAPGEAPASATGRLRSSYRFQTKRKNNQVVGQVGSPLIYAVHLEKGTSKMAPRPHLLPAYYAREREIKEALSRIWV